MVTIRTYFNNAEAWLAKSVLANEGIEAEVASDSVNTFYAIALPARLQVPEEDSERALAILDQHEESLPQQPPESTSAPAIAPETAGPAEAEQIPERKIGSPSLAHQWAPLAFCLLAVIVAAWALFMCLAPPQWLYGMDQLIRAGNSYLEKKDYDSALKYYNAALVLRPMDTGAHYDRGLAYYWKGDYAKAIADFSDDLKIEHRDWQAHLVRGQAYAKTGQNALALDDFDKAIEIDPDRGASYRERAVLYEFSEAWDAAIDDLDTAIKLDSSDYQSYRSRSYVHYRQGDYDLAMADVNESLSISPMANYRAYIIRALIYARKEQYDKTFADFDVVLKHNPDDSAALVNRGFVYVKMQDYNKALDNLNQSIAIKSDDPIAYLNRAFVYSRKGDVQKAVADFNRAIQLAPSKWQCYDEFAWHYATNPQASARDGAKAVELASKAGDLSNWKHCGCLETLAAAEAETGDFPAALKHATQAQTMAQEDKTLTTEDRGIMADVLKHCQQGTPYRDTRH
ncbi:MAG TPA: tetratricopeptide repeat protein [Chthoniobacteraceae bacterium]|nr:tetratricopeptide repeat protein [Chthoniobacteraceae bacterium]